MTRLLFSSHHLLPKSRGGAGHGANMVRLVHSFHNRWHVLFENKTPHEQLDLWYDVNRQILETPVREKVENILSDGEYIYKNGVLRPHE